jgi:ABC-2 type transport system permease protein
MSPLATMLRFEWRRLCRDRALPWLLALHVILCTYAAWIGAGWVAERQSLLEDIAVAQARQNDEYLTQMAASVRRDAAWPAAAFLPLGMRYQPTLPLAPLATLSQGQAEGYPFEATLHALSSAHSVFGMVGVDLDHPATLAAGVFDLAFVIVVLLPLLVLASTYDLWTAEKEQGTAALGLAQATLPITVFATKFMVRGGCLLVAYTLATLTVLGVTVAVTPGEIPVDLLTAGVAIALYAFFWVAVAVAINLYARSPAEAAIGCGAAWLSLVVVVPALLSVAVDVARPVPPRAALINAMRALDLVQEQREKAIQHSTIRIRHEAGRPDRRAQWLAKLQRAERGDWERAALTSPWDSQQRARLRLAQRLGYFSPAALVQGALDRIAGTDADRAIAFERQVRRFLDELRRYSMSAQSRGASKDIAASFRELPRFAFNEPIGLRWMPLVADLGALLGWSLLPAGIVLAALRHRRLVQTMDRGG